MSNQTTSEMSFNISSADAKSLIQMAKLPFSESQDPKKLPQGSYGFFDNGAIWVTLGPFKVTRTEIFKEQRTTEVRYGCITLIQRNPNADTLTSLSGEGGVLFDPVLYRNQVLAIGKTLAIGGACYARTGGNVLMYEYLYEALGPEGAGEAMFQLGQTIAELSPTASTYELAMGVAKKLRTGAEDLDDLLDDIVERGPAEVEEAVDNYRRMAKGLYEASRHLL